MIREVLKTHIIKFFFVAIADLYPGGAVFYFCLARTTLQVEGITHVDVG